MIRWLLGATLLAPGTAQAADDGAGVSIAYNAAIVSDYRFRGLSYTNRKPAVQGGVDVSLSSGWFAGTWLSNLADYGGAHTEVDLYAGYAGTAGGWSYTATLLGYAYPNGRDTDYFELQSTVSRTIGPATATVTVAYYPKQWNTDSNLYTSLGADVAILGTPLTASASIGRENGSYDEKWDWSAGLSYQLDVLELSARYVDTNYKSPLEAGKNGRATALLSVKASF
jgi:uncharacterized protein (TIGR02001 family)